MFPIFLSFNSSLLPFNFKCLINTCIMTFSVSIFLPLQLMLEHQVWIIFYSWNSWKWNSWLICIAFLSHSLTKSMLSHVLPKSKWILPNLFLPQNYWGNCKSWNSNHARFFWTFVRSYYSFCFSLNLWQFKITILRAPTDATMAKSGTDATCTTDFLQIPGGSNVKKILFWVFKDKIYLRVSYLLSYGLKWLNLEPF